MRANRDVSRVDILERTDRHVLGDLAWTTVTPGCRFEPARDGRGFFVCSGEQFAVRDWAAGDDVRLRFSVPLQVYADSAIRYLPQHHMFVLGAAAQRSSDGTWPLLHLYTEAGTLAAQITTREAPEAIFWLTCSPDEKWAAAAGTFHVYLINLQERRVVRTLSACGQPIVALTDRRGVAFFVTDTLADEEGHGVWGVKRVEWEGGERPVASGLPQIYHLAQSPSGTLLATGHASANSSIRIWNVEDGTLVASRQWDLQRGADGQPMPLSDIAFSPDGSRLLCTFRDGRFEVVPVPAGTPDSRPARP